MFSKKQLITTALVLAMIFHFLFYINLYGPRITILQSYLPYILAFASIAIMLLIYFGTYWRRDINGLFTKWIYDLLILWILISLFRSLLEMRSAKEVMPYLFSNYMAISLFPVLFFIVGVNVRYFQLTNRIFFLYILIAAVPAFLLLGHFELQIFLLMPLFFIILTVPYRSVWLKLLIMLITLAVVFASLTNRAGLLRILISLCILGAYYIMTNINISKRIINLLVLIILTIPVFSLYLGIKGQSVFQIVLGENEVNYGQHNPYADTRTFLYFEVFQDLKYNHAIIAGKGLNAGYTSEAFETYNRPVVEVCFLQIILKTGIIGFLLYMYLIASAISNALTRSNNLFVKSLGFLLVGYTLMIFLENQIAYNLLNVLIWIVIGMCHSKEIRDLDDQGIKGLFYQTSPKTKVWGVISNKNLPISKI